MASSSRKPTSTPAAKANSRRKRQSTTSPSSDLKNDPQQPEAEETTVELHTTSAEKLPGLTMMPSVLQSSPQSHDSIALHVGRRSLFEDPVFVAFWLSRFLSQTAQGALMYGLLVLLVDSTDSSFMNSIFVVCAVIPAILFGLPAGVVVDSLPKRWLLVALNILRFGFVLSFALSAMTISAIFATALAIWMMHQFYAPAESSTLATIVPPRRLTEAQALSNLALISAQGFGLILLAPIMLKTLDPRYLFTVCAGLFLTSALLVAQLNRQATRRRRARSTEPESVSETLLAGARLLFRDPLLFRISMIDMIVGIGLSALVVIAPLFLKRILNTSSENTVFVFAPAAIGVIVGLKTAPWLAERIPLRFVASSGLIIFALSIAAFGFMSDIYAFLDGTLNIPIEDFARTFKIAPLALMVMLFSIPAGFSSSVVGVAARSVTLMRAPEDARGQVIATQSLVQNLGALLPTLMAGVAADIIGVERVAVAIAIIMIVTAGITFATSKPVPVLMPPSSPGMA